MIKMILHAIQEKSGFHEACSEMYSPCIWPVKAAKRNEINIDPSSERMIRFS
jgi:hypothetical protein